MNLAATGFIFLIIYVCLMAAATIVELTEGTVPVFCLGRQLFA